MDFDKSQFKKRGLHTNGFYLPYNPKLIDRARIFRKNMTAAEKKIWNLYLKNTKYRVLRQRVIDHFIVDFYCPKLRLVIEIDGGVHIHHDQKLSDEERTKYLTAYHIHLIRITNERILHDFNSVCQDLDKYFKK